jgi:hypothetical protein
MRSVELQRSGNELSACPTEREAVRPPHFDSRTKAANDLSHVFHFRQKNTLSTIWEAAARRFFFM